MDTGAGRLRDRTSLATAEKCAFNERVFLSTFSVKRVTNKRRQPPAQFARLAIDSNNTLKKG